ncbi:Hypothetical predicted protein [Paramuricea clavata]|uniref:Reverse transcriptase domain-containing protein n=1 Tax=Paramuricea clavata TaxID=317549 RepID=A0A7D9IE60_PARCT|nr:Hypothetical predicted protein [Paramuricea clavata]
MDSKWQVWKDLLASAVDDSIPKVGAKRRQNAPWITRELILLCRKKRSAYKKAKRTGKTKNQNYYSKLNNMVKRKCNIARWEYINSLAENISSNDAKPFWRYVNSKRKGTSNLILLKTQDGEITNDSEIAERMNNYFSSVFTEETFENFPSIIQRTKDSLTNIECTVAEVERHLKQLNVNKSPGPDDISPHVLKQCCTQLAPSLTTFLNESFSTVISKVAEKIVQDRCVKFWLDRHIFGEHQFGFQPNKSTLSQLLLCFNDWTKSRDEATPTDVVIMDFCKAFDSVPHERLLYKLKQHGTGGALLDWFRYFLTDRYQRVIVRGSQSNWSPVKSWVP